MIYSLLWELSPANHVKLSMVQRAGVTWCSGANLVLLGRHRLKPPHFVAPECTLRIVYYYYDPRRGLAGQKSAFKSFV